MALEIVKSISYNVTTKQMEIKEIEMDIEPYVEPVVPKSQLELLQETVDMILVESLGGI